MGSGTPVPEAEFLWRLDWHPNSRALALAEGAALGAGEQVAPGLFRSQRPYVAGLVAYGLGGGRIVAAGTPAQLSTQCSGRELAAGTRVFMPRGPWKPSGSRLEFLGQLGPDLVHGVRGCPLELYATDDRWYLVERDAAQPFSAPELPYRTSTSTSSRLARAIVNLVARAGDAVLDPICGTGVLLIEAARLGCSVRGSDTNVKACHMARANFSALGLEAEIVVRDAFEPTDEFADVVVGDLPYGRRLQPSAVEPLARLLAARAKRWALIADADLSEALRAAGTEPRLVIEVPKATFSRYVLVG